MSELGYLSEIDNSLCDECPADQEAANELYREAIRVGADDYAAFALAWNYLYGLGFERDLKQALHWAVFAARVGEDRAVDLIYNILAAASGEELLELVDYSVVIAQLTPGAEGGDPNYQYRLGQVLEAQGQYEEALEWYRKAADQGHADAENAVARLE